MLVCIPLLNPSFALYIFLVNCQSIWANKLLIISYCYTLQSAIGACNTAGTDLFFSQSYIHKNQHNLGDIANSTVVKPNTLSSEENTKADKKLQKKNYVIYLKNASFL